MAEEKQALRKIDAPLYNYFQAIILSFYSRRLYVDVGKRWKGFGMLYLLLVMFLFTLPFGLRIISDFDTFFEQQLIEPIKQLPPIYIQNGEVSFDKPMPYFIKNESGEVVSIIDTTGAIKSIDDTYPHLATLITKDKFYYRVPSPQFFFTKQPNKEKDPVYVQPLSKDINQIFDGKTWVESSGLSRVKLVSQLIIYPTIALVFFAIYLVFLLVFALMGQFLARLFFHLTISYKQTARLLAVSLTPQILFLVSGLTLDWLFPGFGLVLIILLAFYFSFAVISLKRESQKLVVS
ncbi:DUF1189 family protein [Legionella clemsonensis]|uniref:DUF1189 domain-containing protein n=1 Tax=Legionella clemsonensis TaxID=1867846 RepID=A0A222P2Q0_9GAMM|nr:DUF1189 family protein [Legionella clemsonensis]ASQ46101.1 hypothetical protein clem_07740 [Legionella clemsonensis]